MQDEGSQLAALLAGAKPGEQVLDLCAGAGGKTLALAAMMAGKGRIVATDSDRARLAPIFDRVKRAGGAQRRRCARRTRRSTISPARWTLVLIDAPCTGTGVWRRRPDAKWRLTERALGNRSASRRRCSPPRARYVKPGGRLVYVTCSLLPEENEDQVAAFVAANPSFRVKRPAEVLAAAGVGAGLADAALAVTNGLVLSPKRTGTDGFFISVLEQRQ